MHGKRIAARFVLDATVREFLPAKKQQDVLCISVARDTTIKAALESSGIAHTEVRRVALGENEIKLDSFVPAGSTLQIIGYRQMQLPQEKLRFAVDCNMAKAVTYLRMLGYSCFYENNIADARLAEVAQSQERIVLSRDKRLFMRSKITKGRFVRASRAQSQLAELVAFFDLTKHMRPFTRCVVCDTPLQSVEKDSIVHRLPPKIKQFYTTFKYCAHCDKVYWAGTHYKRMMELIQKL